MPPPPAAPPLAHLPEHPSFAAVPAYAPAEIVVEIARTTDGTPHIHAHDFESLGYGHGYVVADDHAAVLLAHLVTLLGERSRHYGRDETPGDNANLDSDLGYRALDYGGQAAGALARMSRHANALIDGFAAGFNRRVSELVEAGEPLALVPPGTPRVLQRNDIAALLLALADEASGRRFVQALALAQPPARTAAPDAHGKAAAGADDASRADPSWSAHTDLPLGSNAWAIGDEAAAGGASVLLANPHFGFNDGLRLYQVHLTIPGALDVAGVSILGCPTVNLGFNASLAWTHTVSSAERFVLQRLRLVPGDPTVYFWDGRPEPMQQRRVAIEIRGEARPHERDLWQTRHGPLLSVPGLAEWNAEWVFCLGNANAGNADVLDHWLAIGAARSLDELEQSFAQWAGTSWVNLLAIDAAGQACYVDGSNVPELDAATLAALAGDHPLAQARRRHGLVVLPGDDPRHALSPRRPRAVGQRPARRTRGVLANFNNPYQRIDCDAALPAHHPLFGAFDAPLTPRARHGLRLTRELVRPIGVAALARLTLDNHVPISDLLLDDLLTLGAACREPVATSGGTRVDLAPALAILRAWCREDALDAPGAPLFREFAQAWLAGAHGYAHDFDPAAPLDTPRGLPYWRGSGPAPALVALATAVEQLAAAGFPPNATLRDLQFRLRADGTRAPLDGGPNLTGALNVSQVGALTPRERLAQFVRGRVPLPTGLAPHGYAVNFGTTWLASIVFDGGRPLVHSVLPQAQRSRPGTAWSDGRPPPPLGTPASHFAFETAQVQAATVTRCELRARAASVTFAASAADAPRRTPPAQPVRPRP
ncbi:penicillin acylase family protein [Burkholderia sp. 22PA0099]|uniref:penicillin acylase family protein n=1 Tax=Burkholderia sp. 22PA0099 TaxID=3237372 RepID=UPI0039C176D0